MTQPKPDPIPGSTSKKQAVLFLVDATVSMLTECQGGITRMDIANMVIQNVCKNMILSAKARASLEMAFVVFDQEPLLTTDFQKLEHMNHKDFNTTHPRYTSCANLEYQNFIHEGKQYNYPVPQFRCAKEGGYTGIGYASLRAIDILEKYVEDKGNGPRGIYPPILVMITDGHPEGERGSEEGTSADYQDPYQEKAIAAICRHCRTDGEPKNLIIPLIIGVGEDNIGKDTLKAYSGGFLDGFFHVRDDIGERLAKLLADIICRSITKTMDLNVDNLRRELREELLDYKETVSDI